MANAGTVVDGLKSVAGENAAEFAAAPAAQPSGTPEAAAPAQTAVLEDGFAGDKGTPDPDKCKTLYLKLAEMFENGTAPSKEEVAGKLYSGRSFSQTTGSGCAVRGTLLAGIPGPDGEAYGELADAPLKVMVYGSERPDAFDSMPQQWVAAVKQEIRSGLGAISAAQFTEKEISFTLPLDGGDVQTRLRKYGKYLIIKRSLEARADYSYYFIDVTAAFTAGARNTSFDPGLYAAVRNIRSLAKRISPDSYDNQDVIQAVNAARRIAMKYDTAAARAFFTGLNELAGHLNQACAYAEDHSKGKELAGNYTYVSGDTWAEIKAWKTRMNGEIQAAMGSLDTLEELAGHIGE